MEENLVLKDGEKIERVYNLQVFDTHEYFANNILVHNCVMSFAMLLQARTQQSCELIPDVVKLKGSWTREEIEDAIEEGRIDRQTALEYKRTVGYYCEPDSSKEERSNRYARR